MAAFNIGGLTPAQVDPNAPYISPAGRTTGMGGLPLPALAAPLRPQPARSTPGSREKVDLVIRARALNVFNMTNFLPAAANTNSSSTFGQITAAYRDISGTVDPGARIMEFLARMNF